MKEAGGGGRGARERVASDAALRDRTLAEYLRLVGSKAPAPGAGSVAALVAALAAGLNEKVARKAKDPSARRLAVTMAKARERLLKLVDEDARSFAAVMAVWKGQPAARQRALKAATRIPLSVCEDSAMIGDVSARLTQVVRGAIRSDAAAAQRLASASLAAARLMAEANLTLIDDAAFTRASREALEQWQPADEV